MNFENSSLFANPLAFQLITAWSNHFRQMSQLFHHQSHPQTPPEPPNIFNNGTIFSTFLNNENLLKEAKNLRKRTPPILSAAVTPPSATATSVIVKSERLIPQSCIPGTTVEKELTFTCGKCGKAFTSQSLLEVQFKEKFLAHYYYF